MFDLNYYKVLFFSTQIQPTIASKHELAVTGLWDLTGDSPTFFRHFSKGALSRGAVEVQGPFQLRGLACGLVPDNSIEHMPFSKVISYRRVAAKTLKHPKYIGQRCQIRMN